MKKLAMTGKWRTHSYTVGLLVEMAAEAEKGRD
jgi:hypothetical protein